MKIEYTCRVDRTTYEKMTNFFTKNSLSLSFFRLATKSVVIHHIYYDENYYHTKKSPFNEKHTIVIFFRINFFAFLLWLKRLSSQTAWMLVSIVFVEVFNRKMWRLGSSSLQNLTLFRVKIFQFKKFNKLYENSLQFLFQSEPKCYSNSALNATILLEKHMWQFTGC